MGNSKLCSLETYWQLLQNTSQKVLLLDYDGTLAPFQLERNKAFPYPGVREILERIQGEINNPKNKKRGSYLPLGLNIEGIFLGLDFIPQHLERFGKIFSHNLAIDNFSNTY